jgi:hypothetical protein
MNNDFFKSLERSISSSRISTYKSNGHTEIETIADYVLNAKISQNFYFLLQNLEVSLRNAIYDSFKKHYPNSDFFYLFENNSFNRYKSKKEKHSRECWKMLCGVKYKLKHMQTLSDGKIIAELNFGFWTELLISRDNKYTDMWRRIFLDVFPNYKIKSSIDKDKISIALKIDDIRNFRNRIFHYEPIYNQSDLIKKHIDIFDILTWLNEDMKILNELFDEFKNIEENKKEIIKKLTNLTLNKDI